MDKNFIEIQLFGEEPETPPEQLPSDPVDTAIADTLLDYQNKYEEEKKARIKAENKVVELSRVIRTMGISNTDKDEPEPTLEDEVKKLFGE